MSLRVWSWWEGCGQDTKGVVATGEPWATGD